ncbi:hypothetical protein GSI_08921 [Ganoderma sinense ZZ0214-1]|uniref:Chromo domain-containing protein n=1 Tax=Ganoderma sinense ZZ0214-1 TaxID=1077348 RepID=A0A2G8S552_9APHY|nr:hypothetical protein GSI_08921 [Ganoderma sinense ZZ0214-1]
MAIGDHREKVVFVVTDIGDEDVIIGLDWLHEHNPEVDWERGSLRLSRCPEACPAHQKASKPIETKARDTEVRPTPLHGITSLTNGPLQPNEVPDGPGQVVTCDFITGLPDVDGYNVLQLIADRHGKIIHLIPCTEEIDAEGTADNFIREWFRLHGLPRKIISDRGPQFSSKLFRAMGNRNEEIEAYLRMYCSRCCDDWVKWLPIAEFAFNSHVHSATGYSPVYLMYGFEPQFHIPMLSTAVPSADERREELRQAREDVTSALTLAAERMKEYYDRYVRDAPEFKDGQKVWLDTRNFRVPGVSRKLVDRYAGPYLVKCKVGNLAYELKLPKDLALHPVFHVSLLLPHKESQLPGRHPPEPASIEVEGEEEYEVEEVLESRRYGRWKKLQYLVHWMGWGPEHDSWEDAADLANAPTVVQKFHSTHLDAPSPFNKKTKSLTVEPCSALAAQVLVDALARLPSRNSGLGGSTTTGRLPTPRAVSTPARTVSSPACTISTTTRTVSTTARTASTTVRTVSTTASSPRSTNPMFSTGRGRRTTIGPMLCPTSLQAEGTATLLIRKGWVVP